MARSCAPTLSTAPARAAATRVLSITVSLRKEFAHFVEPRLAARVVARGIALAEGLEFVQQLALPLGQVDRRLDHDVAEQVAVLLAAYAVDALAAQPEGPAALRLRRHLDARAAVEPRDFDLAAQRRRGKRHP